MKSLFLILKQHIVEDFNILIYSYTMIFLSLAIWVNYHFGFEDRFIIPHFNTFTCFIYYSFMYGFAYYVVAIPILIVKKKFDVIRNPVFWIKSSFIILLVGFDRGFSFYRMITENLPFYEKFYLNRVLSNLEGLFVILIPAIFLKLFFDRKEKSLYGLTLKKSRLKTFLGLILFMVPLVAWASFQSDFQNYYPVFKFWGCPELFGLKKGVMSFIFEIAYATDFVIVEFLYRGLLVIAMVSLLGKDAILPMVSVYVIIHFGKPVAETISSFFGGYILGVFALNLRSIMGGAVVHIGLAWLMEIGAILQYFIVQKNQ